MYVYILNSSISFENIYNTIIYSTYKYIYIYILIYIHSIIITSIFNLEVSEACIILVGSIGTITFPSTSSKFSSISSSSSSSTERRLILVFLGLKDARLLCLRYGSGDSDDSARDGCLYNACVNVIWSVSSPLS